jgi:GH24 family phage-related lysozyme (muramidase)
MNWYSGCNLKEFESYLSSLRTVKTAGSGDIKSDPNFEKIRKWVKTLLMTGVSAVAILSSLGAYLQSQDQAEQWKQEITQIEQEKAVEVAEEAVVDKSQDETPDPEPKSVVSQEVDDQELFQQLSMHEGYREWSYDDTKGYRTIGLGFNMDRPKAKEFTKSVLGIDDAEWQLLYDGKAKLNKDQVFALFQQNLQESKDIAERFLPNFHEQPKIVKHILIDMGFMGEGSLSGFKDFRAALMNFDYNEAAKEMEDSPWFHQTKNRARRLINMMVMYANMHDKYDDETTSKNMNKMWNNYFGEEK